MYRFFQSTYKYLSTSLEGGTGPSDSTGTGLNRDLGDSTLQRKKFDVSFTVIKKNRFCVDINKLVAHTNGGLNPFKFIKFSFF